MSNNIKIANSQQLRELFPGELGDEIINSFKNDGECSSCGLPLGSELCVVEVGVRHSNQSVTNPYHLNDGEIFGAILFPRHIRCDKNFHETSFTGASTWNANVFAEAIPTPEGPAITPIFAVNPSVDVIMVVKNPITHSWPKTLIEPLESNGFYRANQVNPLSEVNAGIITFFPESSTIRVECFFDTWDLEVDEEFIKLIRECGGIIMALSYEADAKMLEANNNCEKFMRGSKTVHGWAALTDDASKTS